MYARKYYLLYIEEICYLNIEEICYLNIQEPVSNNIQEPVSNPSSFYVKSLLTFWPFCHSLHTSNSSNSPRSPFTSFTIHFFTFTFSPFSLHFLSFSFPVPLLSPPPFIPLYLTTSGTKTEKNRDNSFVSRKNVLTLQP